MKSVKGTKTEKNLLAAFAGESQARNRYTFFASKAKKEGYEQIAAIFLETADNEKEHAEVFFKHLRGGTAEITAEYPAGMIGNTAENLKEAAEGEKMEWGTLYPTFAEIAQLEGFPEEARSFHEIAKVEAYHEKRYRKLLHNVETGGVFKRAKSVKWKCRNCGRTFTDYPFFRLAVQAIRHTLPDGTERGVPAGWESRAGDAGRVSAEEQGRLSGIGQAQPATHRISRFGDRSAGHGLARCRAGYGCFASRTAFLSSTDRRS